MPARGRTEAAVLQDGVITALVARQGQRERVAVHLNGRRAFDLATLLVDQAGLRAGAVLTAEQQQYLLTRDAPYRARERALGLLGLHDRSRREIELRLRQAGFDSVVISQTVQWLTDLGYLDDRRFAATYAGEKGRGGWGVRRIKAGLATKGVERAVIDEVLAPLEETEGIGAEGADTALEQMVRRRFAGQFRVDPNAAARRVAGFLARRGYEWETIDRMVRMLLVEAGFDDGAGTASNPQSPSIP